MKRRNQGKPLIDRLKFRTPMSFLLGIPTYLLLPLFAAMLWVAAGALNRYLLGSLAGHSFLRLSHQSSRLMFMVAFSSVLLISWILMGKATKAPAEHVSNINAVAKAGTVIALSITGIVALVSGITHSGSFVTRSLSAGEIELVFGVILATILAAFSAMVTAYRVVKKRIAPEAAEMIFATATAIATLAVAGTVIMLLFVILFLRILEVVAVGAALGVFLGILLAALIAGVKRVFMKK